MQGATATTLDVIALTAPSVAAPTNVGSTQNGSYTFASGAIVLADIDAINNTVDSLSLAVSKGTLKLGSTTGITFSSGANGASSMTITGTLTSLNAALSGLVYTSTAGFSGQDTLSISVTDTADNLKGTGSVGLSVNPFVTAPGDGLDAGEYVAHLLERLIDQRDRWRSRWDLRFGDLDRRSRKARAGLDERNHLRSGCQQLLVHDDLRHAGEFECGLERPGLYADRELQRLRHAARFPPGFRRLPLRVRRGRDHRECGAVGDRTHVRQCARECVGDLLDFQ